MLAPIMRRTGLAYGHVVMRLQGKLVGVVGPGSSVLLVIGGHFHGACHPLLMYDVRRIFTNRWRVSLSVTRASTAPSPQL